MSTVKQILSIKGNDVWTVPDGGTVLDALQVMADKNIGSVCVKDKDDRLVGIFSERDYARKVVLQGKRSKDTRVSDVMTTDLTTIDPGTAINTCMSLMTENRIRHLPVYDADKLIGVISIGDVVKAIIREQQDRIRDMENYIQGGVGN